MNKGEHEMDILKDIVNILIQHDDISHMLEIKIAWDGITIYLDEDPEKIFSHKYIIPIKYDTIYDCIFIDDKEYKEKFHDCELGIDYQEIIVIKSIMDYLYKHKKEISDICKLYDFEHRYNDIEDDIHKR